jgi:RNA polymerase sigma-70 factor (ECF subfamily)
VDHSIVEAARGGDRSAFDALVRTEIDRVYRLALAITGNEADASDATQDAFVSAWRSIRDLRDAGSFDAWMARLTVNASRMVLRGRRRRLVREITVADVDPRAPRGGDGSRDGALEDAIDLQAALSRLQPELRAILVLHHLEGRGLPELASILGVPEGTVKSRLHTARLALQRWLDREQRRG